MKKIGILTFHRANNYGALLQTYALKRFLKSIVLKVFIINYLCDAIENYYKLFPKSLLKFNIKNLIRIIKRFLFLPLIVYFNFKFKKFKEVYLIDTLPFTCNSISSIENEYDIFITGSDQVFNPQLTGFDKNYFLDFVKDKNKCFSYAASFGLSYESLTEQEKMFINQNLQNFKYLSLREKQGMDIVNKLSNIKSEIHIDPTLLLNKQDWSKVSKIPKETEFVLVYLMNNNKKIMKYADELAKNKKLKIKIITLKFRELINKNTLMPSPQEWLGYFLKAKYIVTNSFHGLCFSINFNKQFFVDFVPTNKRNSRFKNLLELTNLGERLIDNIGIDYDKPINWSNVNKIIEQEKSLNYLKSIAL